MVEKIGAKENKSKLSIKLQARLECRNEFVLASTSATDR